MPNAACLPYILRAICFNKKGLEIGGPSSAVDLKHSVYDVVKTMDNVVFAKDTVWAQHMDRYEFREGSYGDLIVCDAVNLCNVERDKYDFILASHVLEHIANPIKAVKEWLRVTQPGGHIILILPERSATFDRRRELTGMDTLVHKYDNNVDERDLSSLPEILEKHDLSLDPPAGTFEQFKERSLRNFENRCLHHHVFGIVLLKQICEFCACDFIFTVTEGNITEGMNIWFVMKKRQ
jgi:SAM-dependent methyltransferase